MVWGGGELRALLQGVGWPSAMQVDTPAAAAVHGTSTEQADGANLSHQQQQQQQQQQQEERPMREWHEQQQQAFQSWQHTAAADAVGEQAQTMSEGLEMSFRLTV